MRKLIRIAAGTGGAEIAETAVVLPLLFMLLIGIVWFGRAFNTYATIHRAARAAALAAAAPACATCGNGFRSSTAIRGNVVDPILTAAHLDPSQVQSSFNVTWDVPLNPGQTPVELGTVVTMSYPYRFKLNGMTCCPLAITPINPGITISAQAQAREEN